MNFSFNSKRQLRKEIRFRVKAISLEKRESDSASAAKILLEQDVWNAAQTILFYAPMPEELDVWPLMTRALMSGKDVGLPRFDSTANRYVVHQITDLAADIQPGRFDIREPRPACPALALNRLDLTLVPGVGFDRHGRRLGRGKGFYDQLLADVRGRTCGVAFDEQIVAEIPVEPHDIHLNCILTPTRWIEP